MKKLLSRFLPIAFVLVVVIVLLIIMIFKKSYFEPKSTDFTYTITDSMAEITEYKGAGGNIKIPDTLGGFPVTHIGVNAFSDCEGLTSITIPRSVEFMSGAIEGCSVLDQINVDGNNLNLSSQDGVVFNKTKTTIVCYPRGKWGSYTIPNTVKSIKLSAFRGCTGLTSITIPNSVTSIADYAFEGCTGLTSITIPNSVTSIEDGAFEGCTGLTSITIPSSVTSIADYAFMECTGLTEINVDENNKNYSSQDSVIFNKNKTTLVSYPSYKTGSYNIPSSVTRIADYAFEGCTGLTSITIPNSVTSIADYAFYRCTKLKNITIPNSVTSIGFKAFSKCTGLTSITIPSSVTSIESNDPMFRGTSYSFKASVFEGCAGLTKINVDDNNMDYSSQDGVLFNKTKTTLISYPGGKIGSYIIPSIVTNIEYGAIQGCKGITKITFPTGVKKIGDYAFSYCENLTAAYFLGNAPKMGSDVFESCSSKFTIHYIKGKTGFSNPWHGYKAKYKDKN